MGRISREIETNDKMKKLLIILLFCLLSACTTPAPVINTVKTETFHPELPLPYTGMKFKGDTWIVLTPETMQKLLDDIKEGKQPSIVFFALNDQDYLTFSQSYQELMTYLLRQKNLICFYRKDLKEPYCESK